MKLLQAITKRITAQAMLYEAQAKKIDNDRFTDINISAIKKKHETAIADINRLECDKLEIGNKHAEEIAKMDEQIKQLQVEREALRLQQEKEIYDRGKIEDKMPNEFDVTRSDSLFGEDDDEPDREDDEGYEDRLSGGSM